MRQMTARVANGMEMAALGERIRLERLRRKLSLEGLAASARVSRSMLSDVGRGAKVPSVLVLDRLATGLGTSIARLLGEEGASAATVNSGAIDQSSSPSPWPTAWPWTPTSGSMSQSRPGWC